MNKIDAIPVPLVIRSYQTFCIPCKPTICCYGNNNVEPPYLDVLCVYLNIVAGFSYSLMYNSVVIVSFPIGAHTSISGFSGGEELSLPYMATETWNF